jgi:acyl-homoserine lactone acylase PvdQ
VIPSGQAGHPFDEHYDDQLPGYVAGELRPMHWSEHEIEAHTHSRLAFAPTR